MIMEKKPLYQNIDWRAHEKDIEWGAKYSILQKGFCEPDIEN